MMQRTGRIATAEGSRYLQRLCLHFNKTHAVTFDPLRGHVGFDFGTCDLHADSEALIFECRGADARAVEQLRQVIDETVKLYSRKEPMTVMWDVLAGP